MGSIVLFGFVADWMRNWLMPVWLLGVGAAVGLILLAALWGIFSVLSRVPALQRIAETTQKRRVVTALLGTILSAVFIWIAHTVNQRSAAIYPVETDTFLLASFFLACVGFALAYLGVAFLSPRNVREIPLAFSEGVLWPIFLIIVFLAALGVVGFGMARQPLSILASVTRIPFVGTKVIDQSVPAALEGEEPKQYELQFGANRSELQNFMVRSSETLEMSSQQDTGSGNLPTSEVRGDEEYRWQKNDQAEEMFPEEFISKLYARNFGAKDAKVQLIINTAPPTPEIWSVIFTAAAVCGVIFLYLLLRTSMPKAFAVALSTAKSETAQPLFAIILALGIVALAVFVFIPYNTFGEDIKMLKDTGLVLIMVLGIIQAVWASSTSVAEEIEGRTALTVLSKPIGRRSFIFGKFFGIFLTVLLLFIVLGLVFMVLVSYKSIYDARESSTEEPIWQVCHFEMVRVLPGLTLAFMETVLLAAISVAISTRLPMIANFVICLTIYVLGHLTPLIVQSTIRSAAFDIVVFVAQFIATLFPVLDHFNIQAAVAGGIDVPYVYLGWAFMYCAIYGMIALLLALLLFEDRDLA